MSLLKSLEKLLGGHQQLQAHQAYSEQLGNNTQAAQQYARNPQAQQFRNVDPAQFGYPADSNSGLRVNHAVPMQQPNLGVSFHQIQGLQNPGFTPMQGSAGYGTSPQMRAYNQPTQLPFNPQDQQDGYVY